MGRGGFRLGHLRALGRVRDWWFGVGIAAVSAAVFASLSGGAPAISSAPASPGGRSIESTLRATYSETGEYRARAGSEIPGLRLASLSMPLAADTRSAAIAGQAAVPRSAANRASFEERFTSVSRRFASFNERFAAAPAADRGSAPWSRQRLDWLASAEKLQETARFAMRDPAPGAPAETEAQPSADAAPDRPVRLAYAPSDAPLGDQRNRTAIYDISRRVIYMPNGDKLEAHSGLGEHMDDLRTIRIKNKGVTPPNVYKLTLREKLFHGQRAVRMTPVDATKMYGRDGFLVHSYLLGPNGESNGCVSVNDYPKFLKAFDNGDVDRLIVVERLVDPPPAPSPEEPGGNWLVERIKALFEAS
jgi:hypothetical protein